MSFPLMQRLLVLVESLKSNTMQMAPLSAIKLIWLQKAIHNVLALTTIKSLHLYFALLCAC
jgi:hypothetical protein